MGRNILCNKIQFGIKFQIEFYFSSIFHLKNHSKEGRIIMKKTICTTHSKGDEKLSEAILEWLDKDKESALDPLYYCSLKHIIETHICPSSIGQKQINTITSDDIQGLIYDKLYGELLSFSSIKKIYFSFYSFFNYLCASEGMKNPMNKVVLPEKKSTLS